MYRGIVERGEQLFEQEKYEEALYLFEGVLEKDPTNTAALEKAGHACKELGRMDQAFTYMKHALSNSEEISTTRMGDVTANDKDLVAANRSGSTSKEKPPIFIGGAGRSGTTLVHSILNSHSNIYVATELKVTPMLIKSYDDIMAYASYLKKRFFVEKDDVNASFRHLVLSLLEKAHQRSGKTRLGEKTPNNVFYFTSLAEIFPGSPLIHVVRDGRDVVKSLLKKNWVDSEGKPLAITRDAEAAARYWKTAVQAGRQAARKSSISCYEIRYEELVEQPEKIAKELLTFIREPWESSVLELGKSYDPHCPAVHRKITSDSVGRWREELTREDKNIVKKVAGGLLLELGYAENLNW